MLRNIHSLGSPFPKGVPPRLPVEERDLPPTLQPGAIFQAAPPPARRLSLFGTLCVYGIVVLLAMVSFQKQPYSFKRPAPGLFMAARLVLEEPMGFHDQAQELGSTLGSGGEIAMPLPQARLDLNLLESSMPDPDFPTALEQKDLHDVIPFPAQPQAIPVSHRSSPGGNGSGQGFGLRTGTGSGFGAGSGMALIRGVPGLTEDLELKDLEVVHEEIPKYSPQALRAGIEGDVVVRVTINPKGVPVYVELQEGHPALRDETTRALWLWRFGRGVFRGRKVNATFDITVRYTIDRGIPPPSTPPLSG